MAQELPIEYGGTGAATAENARASLGAIGIDKALPMSYLKGNQNFNVDGADGGLTSSNQTFTNGQYFSAEWYVSSVVDLVDISIVSGVVTATSGSMQRRYPIDAAGLITESSVYASIIDSAGVQAYAADTAGLTISSDATYIYVTIDWDTYTGDIAYVGLSSEQGMIAPISDEESIKSKILTSALINFEGSDASINYSINFATSVKDAVGQFSFTFDIELANDKYFIGFCDESALSNIMHYVTAKTLNGFSVDFRNASSGAYQDPTSPTIMISGV